MKAQIVLSCLGSAGASLGFHGGTETLARQTSWTIGQTVNTTSGLVHGHAATNTVEVSEYLGIPYARAPVGDLRFQPPVKYPYNSTDAISGDKFGPSCLSTNSTNGNNDPNLDAGLGLTEIGKYVLQGRGGLGGTATAASEDCLSLNIWTKPQVGEEKKAVMFWIYGGAFVAGGSSIPWYDGQYIVDQEDVVLVSINYRLSIFGFPGNPIGTANLGLLDQRLALEWVRDNIASFGGDPARITLVGQSAGAISIDYYTYAFVDDPIAQAYIPMSGAATGFKQLSQSSASDAWYSATNSLGCGRGDGNSANKTTPEKVLECMMSKSSKELASITPSAGSSGSRTGLSFGPTVDDKTVFANYTDRTPAKGPLLIGNTDFEAGFFRLLAPSLPEKLWPIFNQVTFVCPAGFRAAVSVLNGNPTWRYRWFGVFPNLILSTTPPSGAWHASDVPVLFNQTPTEPIPNTSEEVAIGNYIRGAWAAFAKNPSTGLDSYGGGWPRYSTNASTLIRLGYENKTGTNLGVGDMYDVTCKGNPVVISPPPNSTEPTSTSTATSTTSSTATPSQTTNAATDRFGTSFRLLATFMFGALLL
ncbi:alpha/beta-hydrolase [Thozetella sp. PMI_491]|nr:alpha/beta-hydrolase [Thozetella sp. PMI_491]